jgi:hypothetical protein
MLSVLFKYPKNLALVSRRNEWFPGYSLEPIYSTHGVRPVTASSEDVRAPVQETYPTAFLLHAPPRLTNHWDSPIGAFVGGGSPRRRHLAFTRFADPN